MKTKSMIFWGFIATALSLVALIRFTKKPQRKTATSFSTDKSSGIIITKPDSDTNKFNVIYIFGGTSYATKEWMMSQIPQSYFLNNIVAVANYTDSFKTVRQKLNAFMEKNNLSQDKVSLIGFSAGGLNVLNSYSKDYKLVGLIDPSNRPEHNNIAYGGNVYMVYNSANWGTYPSIQNNMKKLANSVARGGSVSASIDMKHKDIPKYFFKTVENILIK